MTISEVDYFFKNPPLVEVAFSVQFEADESFHIGVLGLLWNDFKTRYPIVDTETAVPNTIEKFGVIERKPMAGFSISDAPPKFRAVFYSENKEFLIQVQDDRFMFNWRNTGESNYPHYSDLKARFWKEFEIFNSFLENNNVPLPSVNQVEFIYINHIDVNGMNVEDVFQNIVHKECLSSDLEMESFFVQLKHLIKDNDENIGRLYTEINKAQLMSDNSDVFVLKFTSRVHPKSDSLSEVSNSMDIMRNVININFGAITTKNMHDIWNKKDL